ncbi:transient receptor potential cation channelsubfamily M member 5 [Striga asiatica]|uniref:Transient receptor potential cation channelsubfamily M member 5 n=1 Tax=Striga asiatica TaxID=4170 RepID=A0A5A7QAR5_STRAF|nr:transient receptor potential cation channelsubfamily M member 5 [Striga asiatica]
MSVFVDYDRQTLTLRIHGDFSLSCSRFLLFLLREIARSSEAKFSHKGRSLRTREDKRGGIKVRRRSIFRSRFSCINYGKVNSCRSSRRHFKPLLSRYVPDISSIPLNQGLKFVPTWKSVPSASWYNKLLKRSADDNGEPLRQRNKLRFKETFEGEGIEGLIKLEIRLLCVDHLTRGSDSNVSHSLSESEYAAWLFARLGSFPSACTLNYAVFQSSNGFVRWGANL